MQQESLHNLAILLMEQSIAQSLNFNDVINTFAVTK